MILWMSQFLTNATTSFVVPAWAITLISVAISTGITSIVGYIIKRSLDNYFKTKDNDQKELQQKLKDLDALKGENIREQRRADLLTVVKGELKPITEKIDALIDKVSKTEEGTLSSLRNDILVCYYRCCEKGYRGDWDFENIHHLYEAYKELHGNSFVKDVMERFDELPSKEEYVKLKIEKKNKKQNKKIEKVDIDKLD